MATVAVFEIHIESSRAVAPTARRMRAGEPAMNREPSTPSATRRSSPFTVIARASRKLPRKTKMMGSANGRKTARASATPASTHNAGPSSAVAGMGMASVTQKTMTRTSTAPTGTSSARAACRAWARARRMKRACET